MKNTQLICFIIFLVFLTTHLKAQQGYSGNGVLDCDHNPNTSPPSPSYLYTCNGLNQSCKAFLIYKSQPLSDSVPTISRLFSSDSTELARINNVSDSYVFPANKEVIIPVNCSCLGDQYYQANTSYVIVGNDVTYYSLATDQFQGLSSCSAFIGENPYGAESLTPGLDLLVPLRCACPTSNQTGDGVAYLLTYSVNENDSLPDISERFGGVSEDETRSGNGFSERDPVIYPLTTLLIPLPREPLPNQTITFRPTEYPPLPPTEAEHRIERSNTAIRYGFGAGIASLFVVSVICSVVIWRQRKKKGKVDASPPKDILDAVAGIDRVLKVFDVEELKAATNDFSSDCMIRGSVYRGKISGSTVAIERTGRDVSNEVNILHKVNHFNIISLRGIGAWGEHRYLVYEYMENGSLRDWLDDCSRSGLWSWPQRVQIAMDVAEGLDYLHNFSDPPYVHKDVKSSNVLLDTNMRAKITNFSQTKDFDGTIGYMAPKLDVYSFGVVISELITGKAAIFEYRGREVELSRVMVSVVEGDDALEELSDLMDPTLRSRNPIGLAMAVAKLCVYCLTRDLESRPSMGKVVSILSKIQTDTLIWAAAYQ